MKDTFLADVFEKFSMAVPTLILDPEFEISHSYDHPINETRLGDGYAQMSARGYQANETWDVQRTGLTTIQISDLLQQLDQYTGVQGFYWQPNDSEPLRIYTCEEWTSSLIAPNLWRLSATFTLDISGECLAFRQYIDPDEIKGYIAGALSWINNYTRNTTPLIQNSNNLLVNSFHDVLGRGGYFPGSSGTSEGQAIAIRACMTAYKATGNTSWRTLGVSMANSFIAYYFNLTTIPSNVNTLWVPHWLINIKYSFPTKGKNAPDPLNNGYFGITVNFTNGVGTIPSGGSTNGQYLSNVFRVYSMDGLLLWQYVLAPLVSGTNYSVQYWVSNFLLGGTNYRIYPDTETSGGSQPTVTGEQAGLIKLNSSYTGQLKVVYLAYNTSEVILPGEKFESFPGWRRVQ